MQKIYLDFETRSEVDIFETGAWIYSAHQSTKILCAGFCDGYETAVHMNDWDLLYKYAMNPDVIFVAHNAFFERVIWKNVLMKHPDFKRFPHIPVHRWQDTMAKGCMYGYPQSLDKMAESMGISERKDRVGKQTMLRLSKPIQEKSGRWYFDNDPEKLKKLYDYCAQDVIVERAIDRKLQDLPDYEQVIWYYDQLINERGVRVDRQSVENIIRLLETKTFELNKELETITGGRVTKGTEVASMVTYLNETGCGIPNLQAGTVTAYINAGKMTETQLKVLRLRQQLGRMSTTKYSKLIHSIDDKDILRGCYAYHSASTGRWGGQLVQLQNLTYDKKGEVNTDQVISDINEYPEGMIDMLYPSNLIETISKCIRGMFIPKVGHEFYVVDYGAIEARVLMWLANDRTGLQEFVKSDKKLDEDIYVQMARRVYKDKTLTKKHNAKERALGKAIILGCGFGMSGKKFQATCAGKGIIITEEEGDEYVNLFRTTYPKVKNYWYDMEGVMFNAFYTPNTVRTLGNISWIYDSKENIMVCTLPSGRCLRYISPEIIKNKFGGDSLSFMTENKSQWIRQDVWGSKMVENVVQAVARDIMAYSIPRLEVAGFPVIMHTHDEIVSERPISENRLDEMIKIMCMENDWDKGCPVVAEGFYCNRYKKG